MGYLSSARGDYGGSYMGRGDPGLFGILGGIAKGALGIAGKILPGPAGAIARFAGGLIPGRRTIAAPVLRMPPGGPPGVARFAGPRVQFRGPGPPPSMPRGFPGMPGYRRRRMNPGNVKALRRAMRRQESFVKLARRALRGSKYKITTAGARTAPRTIIRESGPGGVTVTR